MDEILLQELLVKLGGKTSWVRGHLIVSKQKYLAGDVRACSFSVGTWPPHVKLLFDADSDARRLHSQIYSSYCMLASSLTSLGIAILTSVRVSRGEYYIHDNGGCSGF